MTRFKKWLHEEKKKRLDCFEECLPSFDGYETFEGFYDDSQKEVIWRCYSNCAGWEELVYDQSGECKYIILDGVVYSGTGEYIRG